jgi:hypothetical protein
VIILKKQLLLMKQVAGAFIASVLPFARLNGRIYISLSSSLESSTNLLMSRSGSFRILSKVSETPSRQYRACARMVRYIT